MAAFNETGNMPSKFTRYIPIKKSRENRKYNFTFRGFLSQQILFQCKQHFLTTERSSYDVCLFFQFDNTISNLYTLNSAYVTDCRNNRRQQILSYLREFSSDNYLFRIEHINQVTNVTSQFRANLFHQLNGQHIFIRRTAEIISAKVISSMDFSSATQSFSPDANGQ